MVFLIIYVIGIFVAFLAIERSEKIRLDDMYNCRLEKVLSYKEYEEVFRQHVSLPAVHIASLASWLSFALIAWSRPEIFEKR